MATIKTAARWRPLSSIAAVLLAAAFGFASTGRADDFYQGKRINLMVGFNPGGGIDTAARLFAKHLGRFIPGNPGIVVQNMEGAAGLVAANYLANRTAADGLTLAVPGRTWFIVGVVKNSGAKFDPAALTYIGSSGSTISALWMRPDSGVSTYAELMASHEKIVLAAMNATTQDSMVPALLASNGAPLRIVRGYNSTGKALLAVEQGENQGIFHIIDGFAKRPDLIENRIVVPILQTQPVFPGLPLVRDVIRASDRPLLDLVMAGEEFGVILAGPSGIPSDRVTLLRKAFVTMVNDAEFIADASKMDVPRGKALDGGAIATMMGNLAGSTSPEIVAAYEKLKE